MPTRPTRQVARTVVIDAMRSVLLVRYDHWEPSLAPYWVPPGGVLELEESHRDAAHRELVEETGLDNFLIGCKLWERSFNYQPSGHDVHQVEQYFLVTLGSTAPSVSNSSSEDIKEHRWWTLAELVATKETIFPEGFALELERLFQELET